jgi:hypothetical protein
MRHLSKSGIITLKALGGPIGSRTTQVQEAYEVHYSDGIRAAKKFSNERQAIEFAKDLIKSKKGLQFVDVFNAGSGFHSTADTDAIVAWWGDSSYTSNKSKHDSKLASKKIKESVVNEGKFKKDDLVYNKRTKTVGIVRFGDDKYGEVKTDADGNVDVNELEKFNPIKNKHHQNVKVAPSTEKEVNSRGLFNPFKSESIKLAKLVK